MTEKHGSNAEVFERLAELERNMASLVTTAESMGTAISRIERNQETLHARQINQGKANWPVVITAGAAFLTLLVFYTGMVSGPIAERQRLTTEFMHREFEFLHNEVSSIERRIEKATADRFTRSDFESWLDRQVLTEPK